MKDEFPISEVSDLPSRFENLFIDTETTGLDKMNDKPFLISLKMNDEARAIKADEISIRWLNDNMPKASVCAFHNAKYDLHMLMNAGLKMSTIERSKIWCTQVAETLINDHRKHYSLNYLCDKRFGVVKSDEALLQWLADHFGGKPERKVQMCRISKAPIKKVAYYAVGDVNLTNMLYDAQIVEIYQQDLVGVMALEMDVLKTLVKLERRGVPINLDLVEKNRVEFMKEHEIMSTTINKIVGFPLNVRSGKQMERAYKILGEIIIYSDKGNPSFNKEILNEKNDKLSKLILKERSLGVMINTFLNKFGEHAYSDGRIRCDFNQTKTDVYGVITGRLSASNPNLMQIPNPKRSGELSSQVRSVFMDSNKIWISADWKQFEFRVFAHYANDPLLIKEFIINPEADYHQLIADLTGLDRDPYAKQLNLGLVFGMGQGLMAKKCGLPYESKTKHGKLFLIAGEKAINIFNKYHNKLPGVRKMLKIAEQRATTRGYIKTIAGRKIRFQNKNSTYKAGGYIFQGSSADLMKMKLVELDQALPGKLILPVHDEFDFLSNKDEIRKDKKIIKEIMEDMPELRVPIRCDIGEGKSWLEASK